MRVQGAGCRVQGAGCRMQGAGCRVQGAWCMVHGAGCRDDTVARANAHAPPGSDNCKFADFLVAPAATLFLEFAW